MFELYAQRDAMRASVRCINNFYSNEAGISWKLTGDALDVVAAEMKEKKQLASAAQSKFGDDDNLAAELSMSKKVSWGTPPDNQANTPIDPSQVIVEAKEEEKNEDMLEKEQKPED